MNVAGWVTPPTPRTPRWSLLQHAAAWDRWTAGPMDRAELIVGGTGDHLSMRHRPVGPHRGYGPLPSRPGSMFHTKHPLCNPELYPPQQIRPTQAVCGQGLVFRDIVRQAKAVRCVPGEASRASVQSRKNMWLLNEWCIQQSLHLQQFTPDDGYLPFGMSV